jgi:LCP family protein required for cell wall assembly
LSGPERLGPERRDAPRRIVPTTKTYGRPVGRGDPAFRKAMTFVAMTILIPGSAHLVAGRRGLGRFLLRVWLTVLGLGLLAGLLFLVNHGFVIGLTFKPWLLGLLRWAAIAVGVGWALAVLHAYVLAHPPAIERSRRLVATGIALLAAGAIVVPTVFVTNIIESQRSLISHLFPTGTADLGARVNILLLGGDAGDDRFGLRPDSINVASVDVDTGRPVLFSLPRNMQRAPFEPGTPLAEEFPDGYVCEDDGCMINGIYTYAIDHPELFPAGETDAERGVNAMKNVVGATLGLDIDFYVIVDLRGFEGIVDALGGVQINVAERVPIGGNADDPNAPVEGYIEPGLQVLDGHEALWYSRSRTDTTDYTRMSRQRCVLGAILREADPANVLLHYTELAGAAESTLATDIPQGSLNALVQVALRAKSQAITSVQFVPPLIPDTRDPDFQLIRATVQEAIKASEDAPDPDDQTSAPPADPGSSTPPPADPGETVAPPAGPVDVADVCSYE